MASPLDSILDIVKRKVAESAAGQKGGVFGSGGILGQITDMLGQRTRPGKAGQGKVRPASEDPYGDPADAAGARNAGSVGGRSVKPASEDPYGDPADQTKR